MCMCSPVDQVTESFQARAAVGAAMDIDEVIVKTGEFGRFQKRAFLATCAASLFTGTQLVQNIFDGALPKDGDLICGNNALLDQCDPNCTQILSPNDPYQSYATEWNYYCGHRRTYVDAVQSMCMLGVLVGALFMGGLADKFGRFPILFGSHILATLFGFVTAFSPNWTVLMAIRFMTGFFISGVGIVGFVLTSELVGASKRNLVGTIPSLAFSAGIALTSVAAWATQNWRYMAGVLGACSFFLVFLTWCFYEESPRWYLNQGKTKQCKAILNKISIINGHGSISDEELNIRAPESPSHSSDSTASCRQLFCNAILLKITLIQLYSWFTNSAVYYGLTLATGEMGSNRYVSVILTALVELPANLLVIYFMNHPRIGRVKTCSGALLAASLFCFLVYATPDEYSKTVVGLACAGKFFICASFDIIYVQAAELYPTAIRNVGLGLVSVFNKIGSVLAPMIVQLDHRYHNSHFIVFGALAVVCAAACVALPETVGRPLPESPEDLYQDIKKSDNSTISLDSKPDQQKLLSGMEDEEDEEENSYV